MKDKNYLVKIKPEYVDEIKKKFNTTTLGKALNSDTAHKILNGNANINLKNYCKLCDLMGWDLPEQLDIQK
ncbi:MAG: hypothetical protein C0603_10545 [Denitrovibrio sp.]|nr:MAG: hypothetical protein C0603_10545 [Denitrovibrio sp.]